MSEPAVPYLASPPVGLNERRRVVANQVWAMGANAEQFQAVGARAAHVSYEYFTGTMTVTDDKGETLFAASPYTPRSFLLAPPRPRWEDAIQPAVWATA